MADAKISALTAASTPLAGTEVLPIVQSGTTKKVAVSSLTAGRAVSTGVLTVVNGTNPYIEMPDGTGTTYIQVASGDLNFVPRSGKNVSISNSNLVIGTAGKGIDFSANANAPGMTSELLNWYEEGTWTGTLTAATPPTVPVTATGRYTRIGNQITVAIEFDNVDTTGASGAMEVTGLPFAAVSAGYGPVMKSGIGTQVIMAGIYGGLSKVIFSDAGTMSTTSIVAGAGVYLRFSATYFM
jgi:hypothetical protein